MRRLCSLGLILIASTASAQQLSYEVRVSDNTATFVAGEKVVAKLEAGPEVAKPYMWPLTTVGGVQVTRDWPMAKGKFDKETTDHVHQKSAWFCHGDVIPEGLELKGKTPHVEGVDFWAEGANHGKIVCTKMTPLQRDGGVRLELEWRLNDGKTPVMNEVRTYTFHYGPRIEGFDDSFIIDTTSTLTAAHYPITFGDTKEGSFGVRVADSMTVKAKGGHFTDSEGRVDDKAVWGQVADWCDYSGKVGDKIAGVAIFADPKNPTASAWHARDYGLMAANPFGRAKSGFPSQKSKSELVKIAKGESITYRFAIYVHPGDVKEGKVAEAFKQFAPPAKK